MKKEKLRTTLIFLVSILFYIAAIVSRFVSTDTSLTVIGICLGSTFLCFGAAYKKKNDDNKNDESSH